MKTLYTEAEGVSKRISITDITEAKVQRAQQRVSELIKEDIGLPSFRIPLTGRENRANSMCQIVVEALSQDDYRREDGDNRANPIYVDLGYESHDGWMSVLETKDLIGIPPVWFSGMFLNEFEHPDIINYRRKERFQDLILPEHQSEFLTQLYRDAHEDSRYEINKDKRPYLEKLVASCQEALGGVKKFDDVMSVVETERRAIIESYRRPSKEAL